MFIYSVITKLYPGLGGSPHRIRQGHTKQTKPNRSYGCNKPTGIRLSYTTLVRYMTVVVNTVVGYLEHWLKTPSGDAAEIERERGAHKIGWKNEHVLDSP